MTLRKILPELITMGIIVILALCYPLVSRGLQYAPPFLFGGLRTMIAGVGILLILPILRQPLTPPNGTWKWVTLFSVLATAITYGTMFLSHEGTSLAAIPVLENLQPFFAIVLAGLFLHEKLSPATRTVLIFGTVGILLMSVPVLVDGAAFNFQRATLALLAALSAAAASVLAKGIKRPDAIITISAWQFIIGSIPLFALSLLFEKGMPIQFTPSFIAALLFWALIGTAAASTVWYILVQKTDVSRLSVMFFLAPAFALLLSNRLYAVPVGVFELSGVGIIISGVILGFKRQTE